VYQELGVNEQEGFDLTDEDFDALVREAERQRSFKKPVVGESTAPEARELSDEELNELLANAPDRETSKALLALAENRAAAPEEKPSAKKAAAKKAAAKPSANKNLQLTIKLKSLWLKKLTINPLKSLRLKKLTINLM
jgi:topoisomerase IA-like protein